MECHSHRLWYIGQSLCYRNQSPENRTTPSIHQALYPQACHLRHQHVPPHQPTHDHQPQLGDGEHKPRNPALPILLRRARIPKRIHNPRHPPRGAHRAREQRIFQPSHQQRRQHAGLVFDVVAVGALGAVEEIGGMIGGGFGGAGVGGGMFDAGGFAVAAGPDAVPLREEGRRCRGQDDVAVKGESVGWSFDYGL